MVASNGTNVPNCDNAIVAPLLRSFLWIDASHFSKDDFARTRGRSLRGSPALLARKSFALFVAGLTSLYAALNLDGFVLE